MTTTTTQPPVSMKSRRSLRPDRPVTRVQRGAALVSLAGGGLFTVLLAGLHLVKPELEPTWRFVSEYALGQAGWMMTCAFISLATSLLGASLDYSPIGMLLSGWALSRTPRWRSLRRPLMITAGISFALMVGFTATLPRDLSLIHI